MNITITTKDLTTNASASGTLIDELAYSANECTSDQIDEDSDTYALDYVVRDFDFEAELLANTKAYKKLFDLASTLEVQLKSADTGKTKHAGAHVALHYPIVWAELLDEYTTILKYEMYAYYDSDLLDSYAPGFAKECEDAIAAQQEQNYREWLHGDYRNWSGVLSLIAEYYGASEPLTYDEKKGDRATFTFDDDALYEKVTGEYSREEGAKMPSARACKKWLLNEIVTSSNARVEKDRADSEKRRAEYARVTAYKADQKAKEEAKRIANLEALTK